MIGAANGSEHPRPSTGLATALEEGRRRVSRLRSALAERPVKRAAVGALAVSLAADPDEIRDVQVRVPVAMARAAAETLLREYAEELKPLLAAVLREEQPLMSSRQRVGEWLQERRGAEIAQRLLP